MTTSAPPAKCSFSIVLWEVLTGKVPWEGFSETKLMKAVVLNEERPSLSPEAAATPLGQLAERCWAQEPMARPPFSVLGRELQGSLDAVKRAAARAGGVLQLPSTWSPLRDPSLAEMVPVAAGEERSAVEAAFMRTMEGRSVEVVEVLRVQNAELWKTFVAKRQGIREREADADSTRVLTRIERRWLFHGTDEDTASKIAADVAAHHQAY